MLFFGYLEQVLRGETYLQITDIGRTRIAAFVAGETKGCGNRYLKL
jgi:hypothetical protein